MASLIGKEIGKYRITERLGQGGMAEVYAGVHTHLDRKVAVKVLHSYLLEGGDFVARFKREAKAVANLRHPNIVQVYDFDIQEDLIFMVMEYIDGVNLHTKLVEVGNRGERMPIKLIGSIINDIASALDYAHSKDMLHRDIKPSNIMIDSDNKAYLTDFGIAKLLSDQKFTATGTLVGTPAYMSPEQSMGDDVSKESDIYSLGVVAFEMLTGQVPYDAKTPIGIVHKQINDPVPNMSELVDGVPSTAQEVINRALAKAPESRFSSAEDLVGALRTALQALESTDPIAVPAEESPTVVDDVLEAPTVTMKAEEMEQPTVVMEGEKKKDEPPAPELKKKQPKAKPAPKPPGEKKKIPLWAAIAGGVALLAVAAVVLTQVLGVGLPGSSSGFLSDDQNVVEVFVQPDQMDQGLSIIDFIPDGNFKIVDLSDGSLAFSTGNGSALDAPDANPEGDWYLYFDIDDHLIHQLPAGSEVTVIVTYLDQGTDEFDLQYDAHSGGDSGDGTFRGAGVLGKTDTGEIKTAEFSLQDALFSNRINGGDFRIGDINDGAEIIYAVNVIYSPAPGEKDTGAEDPGSQIEDPAVGEELFNQAQTFFDENRYEEALDIGFQALDAGYENFNSYHLMGRIFRQLGMYQDAIEQFDRALEYDPDAFWSYYNRGQCNLEIGDIDGAIEDLHRATELDPDNAPAFTGLGTAYFYSGQEDNMGPAHEALDRAIELQPDNYQARLIRGELRWFHFRSVDALEDLNIAVDLAPDLAPRPFSSRGIFFRETDQYQLCVDDLSVYIEIDPDNPWGWWQRGECFQLLGEDDPARADYETFMGISEGDPEYDELRSEVQAWLEQN